MGKGGKTLNPADAHSTFAVALEKLVSTDRITFRESDPQERIEKGH